MREWSASLVDVMFSFGQFPWRAKGRRRILLLLVPRSCTVDDNEPEIGVERSQESHRRAMRAHLSAAQQHREAAAHHRRAAVVEEAAALDGVGDMAAHIEAAAA